MLMHQKTFQLKKKEKRKKNAKPLDGGDGASPRPPLTLPHPPPLYPALPAFHPALTAHDSALLRFAPPSPWPRKPVYSRLAPQSFLTGEGKKKEASSVNLEKQTTPHQERVAAETPACIASLPLACWRTTPPPQRRAKSP